MESESLRQAIEEASGYLRHGWPDHAEMLLRQILRSDPDAADALHLLGTICSQTGRTEEGVDLLRRAIAANPDSAESHYILGTIVGQQGGADEAVFNLRQAARIKPDYANAHSNLALALSIQEKLDEAVIHLREALRIKPDHVDALGNMGYMLGLQGKADEGAAFCRRAVNLAPHNTQMHGNLLFLLNYCPGCDAQAIYEEHCRWDLLHARPLARFIRPHPNDRSPQRRLRIGYVSSNFRHHANSFFQTPLFSAHDHEQFEIVCYSATTRPDDITQRLRGYADLWRNIAGLTDDRLASLVRQDRIDILVDLDLHTEGSQNLLFAQKPAPIQACWLGYPGTTGLSTIDYRLTDPYLDPPGLNDRFYSEQSIRLRDSFWCYDPLTDEPSVNALPASANGFVAFGCLNSFRKINDAVLELWAQVLKRVGRSRLILRAPEGSCRLRVLDVLKAQGVTPDRARFLDSQPRRQYLELYHQIDIGLDTFPYNGHTTSLDSFWMGVPVVTIVGQTAVGRAGLSQLTNLGLPELIAHAPEEFIKIAAELATDLPRLSDMRAGLRDRMQRSPLMDAPRFARSIEAAYRDMWRKWCSK